MSKKVYIITSEGGAGHKAAAEDSVKQLTAGNPAKYTIDELETVFVMPPLQKDYNPTFTNMIAQFFQYSKKDEIQQKQQKSWLQLLGFDVGLMGVENWNKAQSAGDIKTTKRLVNQQWISELLFGRIFRSNVSKYLKAHPETVLVIDTQAQNTHQILRAVSDYNQKTGKNVQFLKRMTDLPNKADHFFLSLKKIRSQDVQYLTLEMPHAPGQPKENLQDNLDYYRTKCPNLFDKNTGDPKCTFTFTDGPIKQPFKAILEAKKNPAELENLVPKNTNMTVPMKVKHNDAVLTQNFTIDAHATVKSIMLGSQAAVAGTLAYVSAEVGAYTAQSKPEYLFVFCGNNANLFEQVQAKADAAKKNSPDLTIVPLINQDAEMIAQVYGRADTVILRAGGISCMEIEAAARPGATIFFHSEGTSDDEAVLAENLIPWEAGNIEHVKATLHSNNNTVKIIRPQMYTQELALAKQAAPLASSTVQDPPVASADPMRESVESTTDSRAAKEAPKPKFK